MHGSLGYLVSITPEEQYEELKNLSKSSDYGYIDFQEYAEQVGKLLDRSSKEIQDILYAQRIRDEPMLDYVKELRKTHKTALLSNVGSGVIDKLFTAEERKELFDVVVLSSEVGMIKPEAGIYEYTLQQLGVAPEESVMIDDLSGNIDGAQAVGMNGVVFQSIDQLQRELRELQNIMHIFIEELLEKNSLCAGTILNDIANNVEFKYYHSKPDKYQIINMTDEIVNLDKRFVSMNKKLRKTKAVFSADACFLRCCVSIKSKINLSS